MKKIQICCKRNKKSISLFAVLDKPAAPEGPLEVSDVTKDSATLSWNPPKDDGGSEIT